MGMTSPRKTARTAIRAAWTLSAGTAVPSNPSSRAAQESWTVTALEPRLFVAPTVASTHMWIMAPTAAIILDAMIVHRGLAAGLAKGIGKARGDHRLARAGGGPRRWGWRTSSRSRGTSWSARVGAPIGARPAS